VRMLSLSGALVWLALLGTTSHACSQDVYSVRGPWLDDRAQAYSLDSLHGSYTVITMAYGACRRVCSSSLNVVQKLAALVADRHVQLNLLVVGLDPEQDKPADWAQLRAERKLWLQNVQFLSGTVSTTRQLANRIGEKYWRYGEHTMHDFRVVLVSPDGRVVRVMDKFDQDVAELLP
jgi:cytochrome oxidase Cu insertion factor (SCO1/SenC/PrrC family)